MRKLPRAVLGALIVASRASQAGEFSSDDETEALEAKEEEREPIADRAPAAFDKRWLEPYFMTGTARMAAERFRAGDFPAASKRLAASLAAWSQHASERNQIRFLLALAQMNQNLWQEAGDIFEDLWTAYPVLAPYHAYYAARCRLRRGDVEGALQWVDRVPEHTVPTAEAILVKIDALIAHRRWADVEKETARFLDRFPTGPRLVEARFRHIEAMQQLQRPIEKIAAGWRRIWAEAPLEVWSTRAEENLSGLVAHLPPARQAALTTRSAEEWITRGRVFFDRNQNAQAEAAFAAALTAPSMDVNKECEARFYRAQSVWKQRQRSRAIPFFAEAKESCHRAQNQDLEVRSLYQHARCLASTGAREQAIALYARIEADFPRHRLADDACLRAAEVLTDAGDGENAEQRLRELPQRYPKGDMASEALWRLAFAAWRAGDGAKALDWLNQATQRFPREEMYFAAGRVPYWKARIYEKRGAKDDARRFYTQAVRDYPLSVYALLALERLRHSFPQTRASLVHELRTMAPDAKKHAIWDFQPQPLFAEPGFLRAVELARLGLGSEVRRELARLGLGLSERSENGQENGGKAGAEDGYWIAAILLDRGHLWSASHAIPRNIVTGYRWFYPNNPRREAQWKIAYPRAFPELVSKHSKTNRIPESLQFAIMREESAFVPKAESFANALGLTQMLVRTAQRFVTWRVTRDALFEPAKNLEAGSRFLSFLLERFDGSLALSIAGYNAGEGAVDRWLRERGNLELDEFLETIPYDETRNYTKRVLASTFAYSWLYDREQPVPSLSFSLPRVGGKTGDSQKPPTREK